MHSLLVSVSMAVVLAQTPPGVGSPTVKKGIRVTLLSASRLSLDEYRAAMAPDPAPWDGGGFYFVFFVENRPSAPVPPGLGEVRVVIGSEPYNAVTNATSSKPFAPSIAIRTPGDALARNANLRARMPPPRADSVGVVLEVFIPGKAVAAGTSGDVTLELCETHRPTPDGRLNALGAMEVSGASVVFRFSFPALK